MCYVRKQRLYRGGLGTVKSTEDGQQDDALGGDWRVIKLSMECWEARASATPRRGL